eukprot:5080582-Amphidinium_carterae.1
MNRDELELVNVEVEVEFGVDVDDVGKVVLTLVGVLVLADVQAHTQKELGTRRQHIGDLVLLQYTLSLLPLEQCE